MTHYNLALVQLGHTVDGLQTFFADLQEQTAEIADLEMYILELREHEKELDKIGEALKYLLELVSKIEDVRL